MKRLLIGALGIAAVAACTDVFAPLAPGPYLSGEATPLVFTAAVSKSRVSVGDTASLIFTLRNPSSQRVVLTFPTGCQIVGRVRRGRHEVWPQPYSCTAAISTIALNAGQQRVVALPFTAISGEELAIWTGLVLTPATYVAYAELENGEGRSTSVDFTIER
jgi:hypothetical protein